MHKKRNSAHRPCEPDPNYNYGECLHQSIMKKAGCQPHWRLFSVQGLPTCSTKSLANKYDGAYWKLAVTMDSDDVSQATNCLTPCTYLEYKVSTLFVYLLYCNLSQLAENPVIMKYAHYYTSICPVFASKKIQIMKEVEAYPILSLVADVGGVLGLFIGFNFLMVLDWIVLGVEKIYINT